MDRIPWGRVSGDDVETAISIFLCRQFFPNAVRVRPSRGDGGIDVLVSSPDGYHIYQIKRFADRFDASEKRQVVDSWDRLRSYAEENHLTIASWNLIMPLDPTKETRLDWFEELTKDAPFDCNFLGLATVEDFAAKFPDVLEYYFGDGKARLEETLKSFLQMITHGDFDAPTDAVERLTAIHRALNSLDPHFSYDFSVESLTRGRPPEVPTLPHMVAAVQHCDDQRCVTFRILARYKEATEDRKVVGKFTLQAVAGSPEAEALEEWAKFGAPLSNVSATQIAVDLPGGFGIEDASGYVSLLSTAPDRPLEFTAWVVDSDGGRHGLNFLVTEVSPSPDGIGMRVSLIDVSCHAIACELRIRRPDADDPLGTCLVRFSVDGSGFTAKRVRAVRECVDFLNLVVPGRSIQLAIRDGRDLGAPWPIPEPLANPEMREVWAAMMDDLVTIQSAMSVPLLFPDLSTLTAESLSAWSTAARLVRGERLTDHWNEARICLDEDVPPQGEAAFWNIEPLSVSVGGATYQLGQVKSTLVSAQFASGAEPLVRDGQRYHLAIPANSDEIVLELVPDAGPGAPTETSV